MSLEHPIFTSLGWAILHSLWIDSLLGFLAVLMLRRMKHLQPQIRYVFACGLLAMMLLLPLAWMSYQLWPWGNSIASRVIVVSALPVSSDQQLFVSWLALAWLVGLSLMSLRLTGGLLYVHSLRWRDVEELPEPWIGRAQALLEKMNFSSPVRIVLSRRVQVPTALGWIRPWVLLPLSTLSGLDLLGFEAILAHELAHIRRRDFLVNLLQSIVETLLFYHPAVWWLSRTIRAERELCCDDLAVAICGSPLGYARALTRLEELRENSSPQTHMALAATGGSLMNRIQRLLAPTPEPSYRWRAALFALVTASALCTAAGFSLWAETQAPKEASPQKEVVTPKKEIRTRVTVLSDDKKEGKETKKVKKVKKIIMIDGDGIDCIEDHLDEGIIEPSWIEEIEGEGRHIIIQKQRSKDSQAQEKDEKKQKEIEIRILKRDAKRLKGIEEDLHEHLKDLKQKEYHLQSKDIEIQTLRSVIEKLQKRLRSLETSEGVTPPKPPTPPAPPVPPPPPPPPPVK